MTIAVDPNYQISNPEAVFTPAIAVYPELITKHIQSAIAMVGDPARMRPHVKTHKTLELTQLLLQAGVTRHKCATFPEAELLADAGAKDVVFAYPLVGPNVGRFRKLIDRYPNCRFQALVDHLEPLKQLADALVGRPTPTAVLIDVETGLGRTGANHESTVALARQMTGLATVQFTGLHVYEGHIHQTDLAQRWSAVQAVWRQVMTIVDSLEQAGISTPALVCGNSATYPLWAKIGKDEPRIECSPGTFFLNDNNYFEWFPDLAFQPAAVLLTRVVSKPCPGRVTLDLGYKAVSADSPLDRRVKLLGLPDARVVLQNEEHLVVETSLADTIRPGDLFYAWPGHVCPTCALHRELLVVEQGKVVGAWQVRARDRILTC